MKNIILISAFAVITNLTAFGQDNKHVEEAKKENQEHLKETVNSKQKSSSEFQKYQMKCEKEISENDKEIAKLKAKNKSTNKNENEKNNKRIIALEHKNDEIKKKIEGFDAKN
jgi:hypothetical protein